MEERDSSFINVGNDVLMLNILERGTEMTGRQHADGNETTNIRRTVETGMLW